MGPTGMQHDADVVRDGQLAAQVRTWMVWLFVRSRAAGGAGSAHCVEKRTNCAHIYLSQPGTLTAFSRWEAPGARSGMVDATNEGDYKGRMRWMMQAKSPVFRN